MKQIKSIISIFICLFIAWTVYGQTSSDEQQRSLNDGNISEKFNYLIKESNNYRNFEVIKRNKFRSLQSMVSDSLDALKSRLNKTGNVMDRRADSIAMVQNQLKTVTDSLNTTLKSRDSISFIGAEFNKGTYKTIMWLLVFGLIIVIVYLIYRGRANQYLLQKTKQNHEKLQKDFDGYKKRALEREQKLKRELMDERNERL